MDLTVSNELTRPFRIPRRKTTGTNNGNDGRELSSPLIVDAKKTNDNEFESSSLKNTHKRRHEDRKYSSGKRERRQLTTVASTSQQPHGNELVAEEFSTIGAIPNKCVPHVYTPIATTSTKDNEQQPSRNIMGESGPSETPVDKIFGEMRTSRLKDKPRNNSETTSPIKEGEERTLTRAELQKHVSDDKACFDFLNRDGLMERILGHKMRYGRVDSHLNMGYVKMEPGERPQQMLSDVEDPFGSSSRPNAAPPPPAPVMKAGPKTPPESSPIARRGPKTPPGSPGPSSPPPPVPGESGSHQNTVVPMDPTSSIMQSVILATGSTAAQIQRIMNDEMAHALNNVAPNVIIETIRNAIRGITPCKGKGDSFLRAVSPRSSQSVGMDVVSEVSSITPPSPPNTKGPFAPPPSVSILGGSQPVGSIPSTIPLAQMMQTPPPPLLPPPPPPSMGLIPPTSHQLPMVLSQPSMGVPIGSVVSMSCLPPPPCPPPPLGMTPLFVPPVPPGVYVNTVSSDMSIPPPLACRPLGNVPISQPPPGYSMNNSSSSFGRQNSSTIGYGHEVSSSHIPPPNYTQAPPPCVVSNGIQREQTQPHSLPSSHFSHCSSNQQPSRTHLPPSYQAPPTQQTCSVLSSAMISMMQLPPPGMAHKTDNAHSIDQSSSNMGPPPNYPAQSTPLTTPPTHSMVNFSAPPPNYTPQKKREESGVESPSTRYSQQTVHHPSTSLKTPGNYQSTFGGNSTTPLRNGTPSTTCSISQSGSSILPSTPLNRDSVMRHSLSKQYSTHLKMTSSNQNTMGSNTSFVSGKHGSNVSNPGSKPFNGVSSSPGNSLTRPLQQNIQATLFSALGLGGGGGGKSVGKIETQSGQQAPPTHRTVLPLLDRYGNPLPTPEEKSRETASMTNTSFGKETGGFLGRGRNF